MNRQLELQLEFQIKANQSEIKVKRVPTINERKQRISLGLEELCELGTDGYGLEVSTIEILENKANSLKLKLKGKHPIQDSEVYNERAALDGVIDIAVINGGSIICQGHHTIFDREYENVSQNNLTKFTKYPLEAQTSVDFHTKNGKENLEIDEVIFNGEPSYSVKDLGNYGKILKPYNYESVTLNIEE